MQETKDTGSIHSWVGRSPGEGNGNPLQYSCLKNPMDRGAWWATVHGVTKSQAWLSDRGDTYAHKDISCYKVKAICKQGIPEFAQRCLSADTG